MSVCIFVPRPKFVCSAVGGGGASPRASGRTAQVSHATGHACRGGLSSTLPKSAERNAYKGGIYHGDGSWHLTPAHVGDVCGRGRRSPGRRVGGASRKRPSGSSSSLRSWTRSSPPSRADPGIGRGLRRDPGPAEGPLWWKEGGYLLFSDIHHSRRMKYVPGQGVRWSGADEPRQRPDPRPAGPAARLRARHQTRHPARARRQPHRARQQLPGPAAQPAERRGRQVRRRIYFTDP